MIFFSEIREASLAAECQILVMGSTQPVAGIYYDSRECIPSSLFIALQGEKKNGTDFLDDAYSRGARHFLCSYGDASAAKKKLSGKDFTLLASDNPVKSYGALAKFYLGTLPGKKIAVTGSCGKTTVKDLAAWFLSLKYRVKKNKKNLNNHLGVPYTVFSFTEPADYYIFEMGMNHSGEIDYLASIINPDLSLITNIQPVHIEFFRDQDAIAMAKAEVFNRQKAGSPTFLNKNCLYYNYLAGLARQQGLQVKTFSRESFSFRTAGLPGNLTTEIIFNKKKYQCNLAGNHNAENIAAAMAIGENEGLHPEIMLQSLQDFYAEKRRFEITGRFSNIIDDAYNSNPASLRSSLELFFSLPYTGKKILVLGDMLELGEHSFSFHCQICQFLQENKNKFTSAIFVGNNMAQALKETGNTGWQYFKTLSEADALLRLIFNPDTFFFFKASHGMNFEELINSVKFL